MELVRPSLKYEQSFRTALGEYASDAPLEYYERAAARLACADFATFVREERERSEGKHLPEGYVPETIFWLVEDEEYRGCLRIRHVLNEHLLRIGGHIGYDIRPSMRRRGYGNRILELGVGEAHKLGIERILLTCDSTNLASRKIIERAGGVLNDEVQQGGGKPAKLRFWI